MIGSLRELYPEKSTKEVAAELGLSVLAVKSKANVLGITKAPTFNRMAHKCLSEDKVQFIREHYHRMPWKELCAAVGISKSALTSYRIKLDLPRRPPGGRFSKAHRPWNFRKKGVMRHSEASRATMFQKNQQPHNTLFDGAISERKDTSGRVYKYIRVAKGKWILLQRYIWDQAYGRIPTGMLVRGFRIVSYG